LPKDNTLGFDEFFLEEGVTIKNTAVNYSSTKRWEHLYPL